MGHATPKQAKKFSIAIKRVAVVKLANINKASLAEDAWYSVTQDEPEN